MCMQDYWDPFHNASYIGYLGEHDDIIKWKHFSCYWPFVQGIHRSPVNSPHKGQWRGALMFSLICVWINGWVNNREAGDLRHYRAHYDVTVMKNTWTEWNSKSLTGLIFQISPVSDFLFQISPANDLAFHPVLGLNYCAIYWINLYMYW